MKFVLFILTTLLTNQVFAQKNKAEDFGFRHFKTKYNGDTIDILIKSKKGDELKPKPIFLFCQGSLPKPLIITEGENNYGVFPFKTDSLEVYYHIAIISKPFIPVIVNKKDLSQDLSYKDAQTGKFPNKYSERNLLDYYVNRNLKVIDFLSQQIFVNKSKLIVAGHSEGSTIAAKLATKTKKITHVIYASGNPLGRIMTMVAQNRANETDTDSTRYGENQIEFWKYVVNDKNNMDDTHGDTNKATYDFSLPPIKHLEKLKIPVLICYGTKDWSAPFNDYLRVEMIRKNKKNFSYKAYIGLEHNYFPLTKTRKPNNEIFNWDKVAYDWLEWTKQN